MADAIMAGIYGVRGMGKSTLAKEKVKAMERVIVFDPQGEYAYLPGFKPVAWSDLAREMKKSRFRLSYKPARGAAPEALHLLCDKILHMREPYADWMARGRPGKPPIDQMLLAVEEMPVSYPVEKLPAGFWGMTEMCERGRHSGVEVIGLAQRMATVSTKFRGNCEEFFVFRQDLINDVDAVCKYIGNEYRDQIRNLPQGQYLHVISGKATLKKTKKP